MAIRPLVVAAGRGLAKDVSSLGRVKKIEEIMDEAEDGANFFFIIIINGRLGNNKVVGGCVQKNFKVFAPPPKSTSLP